MKHSIILFDGICNYCNSTVNFIIANDPDDRFRFATLQSEAGKKILEQYGMSSVLTPALIGICNPDLKSNNSFYLIEDGLVYSHSTAAFKVLRHLRWYFSWMYVFKIIPSFLSDFFYNLVARNRYKIFGKRDECMLPAQEVKGKFLS